VKKDKLARKSIPYCGQHDSAKKIIPFTQLEFQLFYHARVQKKLRYRSIRLAVQSRAQGSAVLYTPLLLTPPMTGPNTFEMEWKKWAGKFQLLLGYAGWEFQTILQRLLIYG
jgi:hypothetical protein